MCLNEPSQIEEKCLSISLKDYLPVNTFPDLVMVELEEWPHALQKNATDRATVSGKGDGEPDAVGLTLKMPSSVFS